MQFDIAFVGHYTKDTIATPQESRTVNGGAFYYGANVTTRMGLATAVITRLATEDFGVVEELRQMGVKVFATPTAESTCLRLVYPTGDPDQRTVYSVGFAGPFTPAEVAGIQARTFHVGASIRGEVPIAVVQALADKGARVSLDVQGFIRVKQGDELVAAPWPEIAETLRFVDVLKADAVEAEFLTGHSRLEEAARSFADYGPGEVVLTHREGVLVLAAGQFHRAPFFSRKVKGRTGRGDTCTSAYLSKRLTAPPAQATAWAAAVTSLKMEREGPFCRDVTDVESLIAERYR